MKYFNKYKQVLTILAVFIVCAFSITVFAQANDVSLIKNDLANISKILLKANIGKVTTKLEKNVVREAYNTANDVFVRLDPKTPDWKRVAIILIATSQKLHGKSDIIVTKYTAMLKEDFGHQASSEPFIILDQEFEDPTLAKQIAILLDGQFPEGWILSLPTLTPTPTPAPKSFIRPIATPTPTLPPTSTPTPTWTPTSTPTPDTTPPAISLSNAPKEIKKLESPVVEVKIAHVQVINVKLFYKKDDKNSTWNPIEMTSVGGGVYKAQIPAQEPLATIKYFIRIQTPLNVYQDTAILGSEESPLKMSIKKPFYKKWWTYAGVAAVAIPVTILLNSGSDTEPTPAPGGVINIDW